MSLMNVEATAIAKGMELKHGNSDHFVTFELDNGERVYFQVSMKIYMLVVEGDRCIITYRDSQYGKKKLKSFERIGKNIPVSTASTNTSSSAIVRNEPSAPVLSSRSMEPRKSFEPVKSLKESSSRFNVTEDLEDNKFDEEPAYKPHKLIQKLDSRANGRKESNRSFDYDEEEDY